ncbi:SCO family protein [Paralcaligenes sp. KSB-10]|uniref:SCO family protein n=1 Tax=Paralcaligenes sp. KSB-10 TaxID=2901142 RepID=UPI001E2FFEE9|nr:SCO family protein [Paralcaligenes sp. KSB-10]UHL66049.1 SCO family protein [Paralcaligenes sp. KSB-10]
MAILRTLLASLVLLLAGGAAFGVVTDQFQAFTTETARRLAVRRHPVQIPPVELQLQSGSRISLADLRGKWLLVDFIYTRCPTYCVALGSEFAQLQDLLSKPLAQGKVQLLSISFDPIHDTPAQLKAYMQRSRDRGLGWIAARPVEPQGLGNLERAFGITVIADPSSGGYTHNAAIHLVDPGGRLVEIFDEDAPNLAGRTVLQRLGQ